MVRQEQMAQAKLAPTIRSLQRPDAKTLVVTAHRSADREIPGAIPVIAEPCGNHVPLRGLLLSRTGAHHLLRVSMHIVEQRGLLPYGFHAADGTMSWYESCPPRETSQVVQRLPPSKHVRIQADREPAVEQEVPGIDEVVFRHAHDQVGHRMTGMKLDHRHHSTQVD